MAVEFVHGGQYWRCDLQIKWDWNRVPPTDYECLPRRSAGSTPQPAAAPDSAPRVSPDGRWAASIENGNVAVRPAAGGATRTLSADGSSGNAYHAGSLRWSSDSKTLSAYRVSAEVWSSDSVTGNVKKLVSPGQWNVN
jgi:hypothetical protein